MKTSPQQEKKNGMDITAIFFIYFNEPWIFSREKKREQIYIH